MKKNRAKAYIDHIKPSSFLAYRDYFKRLYVATKENDTDYSYADFAVDLGYPASTIMHQIVAGYRPLTTKAAKNVIRHLGIKGIERQYLEALVDYENEKSAPAREKLFNKLLALKAKVTPDELDRAYLSYFSEWYHPVIREIVVMPDADLNPAWIAERVFPKIKPEQARKSIELLAQLGLIEFDSEQKRYRQSEKTVATGQRIRGMAVASYHQQMIELAKQSVMRVAGDKRDISSLTVAINETMMKRLQSMIHNFQMQLMSETETAHEGDQVYQINIQLFPLSEKVKK